MKTCFLMKTAPFYKKIPLSYKKNTHGLLINKNSISKMTFYKKNYFLKKIETPDAYLT